MRVPVTWLKEYLSGSAETDAIAAVLTARGFAVDAIERQPMPGRIVVGRVEKLERHPNADRLWVSQVDVGREKLQIVTGASNVAAGNRVPIALVGAEVYEHGATDGAAGSTHVIRKSALRGVDSAGMMCSSTELALPGEFEDGILILDDDAQIGSDFWRAVRYGDAVLDVDVPSNRPDCLSMIGLAREVAAGLHIAWREPGFPENVGKATAPLTVEIQDPALCHRFVGQGFAVSARRRSPMWMTLRLHAAGVRSIDFLIDVSNYAMLETGQPLHFYDAALVAGGKLVARAARAGESLTTLDAVTRALPQGTPVIADDDGSVGVAGIFGGARTGVSAQTRTLFLEAANFSGPAIRRAAVALGLRTEGSARHEKNLPLELPELGRRSAAKLLVEGGATPSRVVVAGKEPAARKSIALRPARANKVLGTDLTPERMLRSLEPIGFAIDGTSVTPPFWRGDVVEEIDLIEEIARTTGYGAIPELEATVSPQSVDEGSFDQESLLAQQTVAFGYNEVVTLPVRGSTTIAAWERSSLPFWGVVEIVNPLSDEQRFLRPSLLPGLLDVAARSWGHTGDELRLFEIGHVFRPSESEPDHSHPGARKEAPALPKSGAYEEHGIIEWPSLCAIAVFSGTVAADAVDRDLLAIKGQTEELVALLAGARGETRAEGRAYFHSGAAGTIEIIGETVAKFGRLHPRLARAYDLPDRAYAFMLYLENLPKQRPVQAYAALPRFPGTQRDIAVVVDEDVSARDLMSAAREAGVPAFENVSAFDEYRGRQVPAGKKSVALRLRFRKPESTITDAEADASLHLILTRLGERFGASLRAGDSSD